MAHNGLRCCRGSLLQNYSVRRPTTLHFFTTICDGEKAVSVRPTQDPRQYVAVVVVVVASSSNVIIILYM